MRSFIHIDAETVEEACGLLDQFKGRASLSAGGTDLLSILKAESLFDYPEAVINIKTIPGLDVIEEDEDGLRIGAAARLRRIADSPLVRKGYAVLAEAARSVATPQIRGMATAAGNLCQDVRCWYYRYPRHIGGPIRCARKGSGPCPAVKGDNRYHAVMGGKRCFAVCPSDTAVAFAALDACVTIAGSAGERTVAVTDFFGALGNVLEKGEMVSSIEVPKLAHPGARQTFLKFILRKPIDFAMVSVATVISAEEGRCTDARIALGAVAQGPVRARKAEEILKGRRIDDDAAAEAAEQALAGARPLSMNGYKIDIAKALVKRAILGNP